MVISRTRSAQKNIAPLSTQSAITSLPWSSALISFAISATRVWICSRLNNVVCAIRARIIASRFRR